MSNVLLTKKQAQQIEEALRHASIFIDGMPACHHRVGVCYCKEAEALATIRAARAQEQAEQEPIGYIDAADFRELCNGNERQYSLFTEDKGRMVAIYAAPVSTKDLTDAERQKSEAALLWTLYHHQGSSSNIGQPIRKLLGIGQHDRLTDEQIAEAKVFYESHTGKGGQSSSYRYVGSFGGAE